MVLANTTIVDKFASAFEAMGAAWVMWLLIVLSVISVAIMLERALYFARHSHGRVAELAEQLARGDLQGALKAVDGRRGLEAEVVRQGVAAAPQGSATVDRVVAMVIKEQRLRYERGLSFLGTLGNNAPFVGLFGTVLGIIEAFAALARNAKAGTMTSGGSNIMSGISEALVATAVGLLVALPAVFMFNTFARWLKSISSRGEILGDALVAHLEAQPSEEPPRPQGR